MNDCNTLDKKAAAEVVGAASAANAASAADSFLRLAKPRPKGALGILSLVFSRFFIIVLLIAAQAAVFVVVYILLDEYVRHLLVLRTICAICFMIYLFNKEMDSTAKLTWMFIVALAPIMGGSFLIFTQVNLGQRRLQERVAKSIQETRGMIPQSRQVLEKIKDDPLGTDDLVKWLNRSGTFPVYENAGVTYYPLGEDKFEAMLEELRKAERFIFMEYFIIEEGYMWGKILEILIEKAKAGVDVRVMYDGMCEISQLPWNYTKLLEEHGIKARAYARIIPLLSSHYNYRDHRKILVIDGKVAFNGGVNLADEYINRTVRFGHWKDTAVKIVGPAVDSFTLMFLQMWSLSEAEPEFDKALFGNAEGVAPGGAEGAATAENSPGAVTAPAATGFVIPYCDCPLDEDKAGETVYQDILSRARSYVHIMTPYLILDSDMLNTIKFAAQRGVDVKIILPGIPDKKIPYALAKSHYRTLLNAGVKIYEYTPGFVHAKVFISDDCKAVVGTINLDYRSLYHHFECATYMYKTDCIPAIEADFQETLAKCRPVTEETMRGDAAFYKIAGPIMKFIAPLM